MREYHAEYDRRIATTRRDAARLARREAEATARIARLVDAIANGAGKFEQIKEALARATVEQAEARDALAEQEALPDLAAHPRIIDAYRQQIEQLNASVLDPAARDKAVPAIRSLIDRIIMRPNTKARGVEIEIEGRLAAILQLATGSGSADQRTFAMERVKVF